MKLLTRLAGMNAWWLVMGLTSVAVAADGQDEGNGAPDSADQIEEESEGAAEEAGSPEAEDSPEAAEATAVKPWARGVSEELQTSALASFKKGNEFFIERDYEKATQHYEEALKSWQHPAIHFNLAVCQVHMDHPIKAQKNIEAAIAYGEAPLGESLYAQALNYKKLLHDRLGYLTVSTKHETIKITLDGQPLLDAAGKNSQVLLPGKHALVARKDGFIPYTRDVIVAPGEPTNVEVKMIPLSEATEFERPMENWIPWTVTASGAAVTLLGGGMQLLAQSKNKEHQNNVDALCQPGCTWEGEPEQEGMNVISRSPERQYKAWNAASIVTMSLGGAALISGVGLLIYNTPRPVIVEDTGVAKLTPRVTPLLGPTVSGAQFDWTF